MVRIDKCVTFRIKKYSTKYLLFQPKPFINKQTVPSVKNGESFKYLGASSICNENHKTKLLSLKETDGLNLHPKNKLLLYHRCVLFKVSWHFTVVELSRTWVIENIDNLVSKYIRLWLDLPISATLNSIVLSKNHPLVKPPSRNALKSSPNIKFKLNGKTLAMARACNTTFTATPRKYFKQ